MVLTAFSERLQLYAEHVKFEHTVFALPFALSAMLLALPQGAFPPPITVIWIVLCMLGGRTYAMGINRILDANIDAKNPRTQNRPLPSGRLGYTESWLLTLLAAGLFIVAAFQLPQICQQLLPVAFFILTLYSFMKRFSSLCHLVLGMALGSSAIGGWLAVTGNWAWPPFFFGLAVMGWVAGFDVIYACLDEEFDRQEGLYSLPAKLGTEKALFLSRAFHIACIIFLVLTGLFIAPPVSGLYWLACLLAAGMLTYEHRLVSPTDLSKVNEAFFTVNGRMSLVFFCLVLLGKWI